MKTQTENHSCLIKNENLPFPVTREWFEITYWQQRDAILGRALGRGTTLFFQHNQQEFVLRSYLRGGLIGHLLKDQYLFIGWHLTRAWQEFRLLEWMHEMELPVPLPVGALLQRRGLVYRASLIMQRLDKAEDLIDKLAKHPLPATVWQQIGVTIAKLHQLNVHHHDLNCKNIMLDANSKVWLIDFDRCGRRKPGRWKQQNLQRLLRSFNKEIRRNRIEHFSEDSWQQLLHGYNKFSQ